MKYNLNNNKNKNHTEENKLSNLTYLIKPYAILRIFILKISYNMLT